ncbi:Hsp70 family protein [Sandaracinus amylolyticus]|uniref:Chaperone protein DnaK n=1 Tax=Sandaracinus amylolyticus TaxID=927083 RepID=A0A0F6SFQ7_9BACT|nr:Hsp70 family protein [Sandaracinus amylolyticus]AKF07364.1 Chaperone protein DnaK [Sandaracinus amylolyticus]
MFVDRAVGIDLGTTNSEIALLEPSEREILVYADRFGRRTVPSAVAWDPKAQAFVVGRAARARRGQTPGPIESIKRRMGQAVKVAVGPHELTPEEISSKILAELRERMREDLQARSGDVEVRIARAVITVPAYFDAPQVEATRRAGELAGLEVAAVLQEPTAAAIYHTWKSQLGDGTGGRQGGRAAPPGGNFLVYDLGGGTFDVSVLRCLGGEYQVLAIDGDNFLGGDDFDRRFAERLRRMLVDKGYALELDVRGSAEDAARFARLVHVAQEVKESLSTSDVVHLSKTDVLIDQAGEPVSIEMELGRAEHEEAIRDLVETTIACCERALARSKEVAGVGLADVDHVVLVGGSTRVPMVVRRVTEALCSGKSKCVQPLQDQVDTCVALGAAVHAAQLGGLRIGDDAMQARFTTPLVGRGERLRVGLELERAPEGTAELGVVSADGSELGRAELASVPAAVRVECALGGEEENAARVEARDASGRALASLPFALYRGELKPRASALSQPSVVAKDIALEVLRAGRRERKVLIPRGSGLPLSTTHELATSDRSGAVVLRLLQNRLPIKTLMLEVPADLPVGTPVTLELKCDEAMRLEARAEVAGRELWARVEPAAATPASAEEIEALLAESEEVARGLWGRDAHAFRREAEPLSAGLREVVGTDPDKLSALATQLRHLIDEFKTAGGGELSPPLHRFEHVLDALRRTVYRAQGALLGMDATTWERRIEDLDARGRAAWDTSDAVAWRRVYNETQALLETAQTQELGAQRLDDPTYLARRVAGLVAWSVAIERSLSDFVPSRADEVRGLQLAERDRLMGALRTKVREPLEKLGETKGAQDTRRALDGIASELERIENAVERLPSIGVVTERR